MDCPRCNEAFHLTWGRYLKAPTGKFSCPACGGVLKGRRPWYYWPLMLAGCCFTGVPLGLLGLLYFDATGAIAGWALGALISGVPIDKYLEDKLGRLSEDKKKAPDNRTTEESEQTPDNQTTETSEQTPDNQTTEKSEKTTSGADDD